MNIGYIGLGKMGAGMVALLQEKGHDVSTYTKSGGGTTQSLSSLVASLSAPRLVWIMVPHAATQGVIDELLPLMEEGDTIIDGGNSPYQESIRRAKVLQEKGIVFLDAGVSGGPAGARNGACIMVGGEADAFTQLEWLWKDLSAPDAYGFMGPAGAGHFTKMVHNGIEYGMMQSLAEGFDLLHHSKEFALDMTKVTTVYATGSVITSRFVSWLLHAYQTHGDDLTDITGSASATGEGAWTKLAAEREGIAVPALDAALAARAASQTTPSYQGKVISALRNEFGGHAAGTDAK